MREKRLCTSHAGERRHQTPEWAAGHLDSGDLAALLGRDELIAQLSLPAHGRVGGGKGAERSPVTLAPSIPFDLVRTQSSLIRNEFLYSFLRGGGADPTLAGPQLATRCWSVIALVSLHSFPPKSDLFESSPCHSPGPAASGPFEGWMTATPSFTQASWQRGRLSAP